jgi:hypothetical protein
MLSIFSGISTSRLPTSIFTSLVSGWSGQQHSSIPKLLRDVLYWVVELTVRRIPTIAAIVIAIPWGLIHMGHQAQLPDSIGIGAALRPLGYFLTCAFFFFLLWFPFLAASVGLSAARQATTARPPYPISTLALSFIPFCFCLWLFLTTPAMARYR